MFKKISIVLLTFTCITSSHASIITFDPAPIPGGSTPKTSYIESGVLFSGSFVHSSSLLSGQASNSSSGYLSFLHGSSLRFEMNDSSLFDLGSIDLSEYSTVFIAPKTVTFTGYYSSGATISQSFTTDGLFDSVGGINDFETFTFGSGFSNLSYVETSTNIFAMDNLEINAAVPLPGALYIFITGFIGLIGFMSKRKHA